MDTAVWSGALLAVLGGVMNGSFAVPMKFTRDWAWENTWLVYSLIGLVIIPVAIALVSVPDLVAAYRASSVDAVAFAIVFGFGWGVGSVLFGLGISRLGLALGFAIILGLTAALGSLIPLLVLSPETLATARGTSILVGLAIVICGIILCARGGALKDDSVEPFPGNPDSAIAGGISRWKYRTGLAICIASGVFSSMLNLALAFGSPVAEAAVGEGATSAGAQNAIWALAVCAGALANVGYTLYLLFRNGSWTAYRGSGGRNWLAAIGMGVLWMAGIAVYGAGASVLGDLGAVIGWPLFMSTVIITSNVWGFVTGEWKQAAPAALRLNLAGVFVLMMAIVVMSAGSTL